jgi:hypothetical protein
MADELTTQFSLAYTKGNDSFSIEPITQQQDVASGVRAAQVQAIGTTYEALSLGDVATDGGAFFARNLDPTNFVEIGREIGAAFEGFVKLLPGEWCYLSGVSDKDLFARANTASVNLLFGIWNP